MKLGAASGPAAKPPVITNAYRATAWSEATAGAIEVGTGVAMASPEGWEVLAALGGGASNFGEFVKELAVGNIEDGFDSIRNSCD